MQNDYERGTGEQRMPSYPPESYGKRFWRLWGPLIIKWGISFAVSLVVIVLYLLAYSSMHYDEIAGIADNQEAMLNFSMSISEEIMKYATQI